MSIADSPWTSGDTSPTLFHNQACSVTLRSSLLHIPNCPELPVEETTEQPILHNPSRYHHHHNISILVHQQYNTYRDDASHIMFMATTEIANTQDFLQQCRKHIWHLTLTTDRNVNVSSQLQIGIRCGRVVKHSTQQKRLVGTVQSGLRRTMAIYHQTTQSSRKEGRAVRRTTGRELLLKKEKCSGGMTAYHMSLGQIDPALGVQSGDPSGSSFRRTFQSPQAIKDIVDDDTQTAGVHNSNS